MSVQRNLKAVTRDDPTFARLPVGARLLYHYMRLEMDRRGIIPADAATLKQYCFRNDAKTRASSIGKWVKSLCKAHRLVPFTWMDVRYFYDPFFVTEDYAGAKEKPRYPVPTEVIFKIASGSSQGRPESISAVVVPEGEIESVGRGAAPQNVDMSQGACSDLPPSASVDFQVLKAAYKRAVAKAEACVASQDASGFNVQAEIVEQILKQAKCIGIPAVKIIGPSLISVPTVEEKSDATQDRGLSRISE